MKDCLWEFVLYNKFLLMNYKYECSLATVGILIVDTVGILAHVT